MPLIALVGGELAYALDPEVREAVCRDPNCGAPMYRRAAKGVVPHWSHNPGTAERCEADREMTAWHFAWQQLCDDKERQEVTVGKHRADVLSRFGWAVEFQHSNMRGDKVREREDGWNGRLVWVQDGIQAVQHEDLLVKADGDYVWHAAPSRIVSSRCHQIVDLGVERDQHDLLWLPGVRMARADGELRGRGVLLSADHFISTWLNGAAPWFPPNWQCSRWEYEQAKPEPTRAAPQPRAARLVEAMQDAVTDRQLGMDAGVCDRATDSPGSPRMALLRTAAPAVAGAAVSRPAPRMALPRKPCIDCTPTPRRHRLSPVPPGYQLCDEHWPRLSWEVGA